MMRKNLKAIHEPRLNNRPNAVERVQGLTGFSLRPFELLRFGNRQPSIFIFDISQSPASRCLLTLFSCSLSPSHSCGEARMGSDIITPDSILIPGASAPGKTCATTAANGLRGVQRKIAISRVSGSSVQRIRLSDRATQTLQVLCQLARTFHD
jgi:hypothetical protein